MSSAYTYIADLTEEGREVPPQSTVSRTLHKDDRSETILFGFAPGQELSEHTVAYSAMLYFVQGEADLVLGEDEMEAKPGTWVHMPPHLAHRVYAKTAVLMLLVLFKA